MRKVRVTFLEDIREVEDLREGEAVATQRGIMVYSGRASSGGLNFVAQGLDLESVEKYTITTFGAMMGHLRSHELETASHRVDAVKNESEYRALNKLIRGAGLWR